MEPMSEDLKMYFYENRLATYSGWPFDEDCACTSENVSSVMLLFTLHGRHCNKEQCESEKKGRTGLNVHGYLDKLR